MVPDANEAVAVTHPDRLPACSNTYGEAELDVVLRRGDWHSWHDAIKWLRTDGMDDSELSPECARDLLGDLEMLERDGVSFTADPRQAVQLVRSHR